MKFHKNPSSGSRVVPCGRTDGQADDVTKVAAAFCNFANAPKKPTVGRNTRIIIIIIIIIIISEHRRGPN
jgi:hypothetical protein